MPRNEPELFTHQKEEHERYMKENRECINWTGIISSVSVTSGLALFCVGLWIKLGKAIKFVLPRIVVQIPSLALEDILLGLSFICLTPWIAVTIYKRFYGEKE